MVKNQSCLVRVLLKILRVKTQSCSVRVLLKILRFKIQSYSVEGPKYNSDNYNPISLTCICYKLLEHNLLSDVLLHIRIHIASFVLVRCIIRHTDTYNIICPCQMQYKQFFFFGAEIVNSQKKTSAKIKCLLFRPKPQKFPTAEITGMTSFVLIIIGFVN